MAKKNGRADEENGAEKRAPKLRHETKRSIWGVVCVGVAAVLVLAYFGMAGPAGGFLFGIFETLLGWGYFALPASLILMAWAFFAARTDRFVDMTLVGGAVLLLAVLGLIHLADPGQGGWLGFGFGSIEALFGKTVAFLICLVAVVISLLVIANAPLRFPSLRQKREESGVTPEPVLGPQEIEEVRAKDKDVAESLEIDSPAVSEPQVAPAVSKKLAKKMRPLQNYVAPPADLLSTSIEKPTTGDLRANANIIKRTLDGFGIPVEMGEINIGPKVTRYTLKPAEGVKLSRITALNQDLALALAAHPIRIEAPIPGKSLVGIEVPNKAAALVRLGSLMVYPEFQEHSLAFALGRDVSGDPIFADIEKMPHLLIAGATGSGKSVVIHSLIVSLLYKNSSSNVRLVLVDPKRVELTAYENLPHLVSSVVTESKKAVGVFRWAISEMDRRYDLLQAAGSRDIKSYNVNVAGQTRGEEKIEPIPYLVIVVDELADLMTTYGREVEGSIVRLAQMARATGIHLVLATQRPSVEVITGLIKANITSRVALQVASQIDSRTILDTAGAEKLLGGGDLLFVSSDLSKPKRIQGSFITETEINKVADFVREHNTAGASLSNEVFADNAPANGNEIFTGFEKDEGDDELYEAAVQVVAEAQKASASLLQRRLKVGYARAARLLDLMETHGVVGPGDGAKPREVFVEQPPIQES